MDKVNFVLWEISEEKFEKQIEEINEKLANLDQCIEGQYTKFDLEQIKKEMGYNLRRKLRRLEDNLNYAQMYNREGDALDASLKLKYDGKEISKVNLILIRSRCKRYLDLKCALLEARDEYARYVNYRESSFNYANKYYDEGDMVESERQAESYRRWSDWADAKKSRVDKLQRLVNKIANSLGISQTSCCDCEEDDSDDAFRC